MRLPIGHRTEMSSGIPFNRVRLVMRDVWVLGAGSVLGENDIVVDIVDVAFHESSRCLVRRTSTMAVAFSRLFFEILVWAVACCSVDERKLVRP